MTKPQTTIEPWLGIVKSTIGLLIGFTGIYVYHTTGNVQEAIYILALAIWVKQ